MTRRILTSNKLALAARLCFVLSFSALVWLGMANPNYRHLASTSPKRPTTEIAAAVAFLASDDSSFITAANFLVDGGISGAYVTPLDI